MIVHGTIIISLNENIIYIRRIASAVVTCRGQSPSCDARQNLIMRNVGLMTLLTHIFVVRLCAANSSRTSSRSPILVRRAFSFSNTGRRSYSVSRRSALIFCGYVLPCSISTEPKVVDMISFRPGCHQRTNTAHKIHKEIHSTKNHHYAFQQFWLMEGDAHYGLVDLLITCENKYVLVRVTGDFKSPSD